MNSRPSVIIGIPAFNEEKNIQSLVTAVLHQERSNYQIKKIIVHSDASTDSTHHIVRNIKSSLVSLFVSPKRKGKTQGIKNLLSLAAKSNAEYLILIDADLQLRQKNCFVKLVHDLQSDHTAIAVSGFVIPEKPKNFIQKVGYFGFYVWEKMVSAYNGETLYFRSSDPLLILRVRDFPQNQIARFNYMHDEFYYLFAKKSKKKILFQKNANAVFYLPLTLTDYIKQMKRYLSNHTIDEELKKFNSSKVTFTFRDRVDALLRVKRPSIVVALSYCLIQLYLHLLIAKKRTTINATWERISA